jgi:hypothetical protein
MMAFERFSGYLPDNIKTATRTRDVARRLRRLAVEPIVKKKLLAVWFQEHPFAAPDDEIKRSVYLDVLGKDFYTKLRG